MQKSSSPQDFDFDEVDVTIIFNGQEYYVPRETVIIIDKHPEWNDPEYVADFGYFGGWNVIYDSNGCQDVIGEIKSNFIDRLEEAQKNEFIQEFSFKETALTGYNLVNHLLKINYAETVVDYCRENGFVFNLSKMKGNKIDLDKVFDKLEKTTDRQWKNFIDKAIEMDINHVLKGQNKNQNKNAH